MSSEEEVETEDLNPHNPAPPSEKIWLPVYLDEEGKHTHDSCISDNTTHLLPPIFCILVFFFKLETLITELISFLIVQYHYGSFRVRFLIFGEECVCIFQNFIYCFYVSILRCNM